MKKIAISAKLILFISILVSAYSCLPYAYPVDPYIVDMDRQKGNSYHAPSVINAPLLSKKNDGNLALHYAMLTQHDGIDIQGAFIPVNHLGLQASFRSYSLKGDDADGKIESFHLGAGYVKDWGMYLFECYGGIGGGSTTNVHYTGSSDIHFTSYYVQPTIAVQTRNKNTQFGLFAKLSPTTFEIRDSSFSGEREPFVADQFAIIANDPKRVFLEPGFVFKTGWENFQFQTAFSYASLLSGKEFRRDKTNFSIGIVARFNAGNFK